MNGLRRAQEYCELTERCHNSYMRAACAGRNVRESLERDADRTALSLSKRIDAIIDENTDDIDAINELAELEVAIFNTLTNRKVDAEMAAEKARGKVSFEELCRLNDLATHSAYAYRKWRGWMQVNKSPRRCEMWEYYAGMLHYAGLCIDLLRAIHEHISPSTIRKIGRKFARTRLESYRKAPGVASNAERSDT